MSVGQPIPVVRVVREGFIVRDEAKILDASSSVTLVEVGGKHIVVDTGSVRDRDIIERALKSMKVRTGDVSTVVNTHLHMDHCGCNELFANARVCAHVLEDPPAGTLQISGAITLLPGVQVIPTPGHTPGSITVLVHSERLHAICGDAIPTRANYEQRVPPFVNFNRALALKSMDMILERADVVVPGHDAPFKVLRKK